MSRRTRRWIEKLRPCWVAGGLAEITTTRLAELGLHGVILDMDNTLAEWRSDDAHPSALVWVKAIHSGGIKTCVVSNTHRPQRLASLCGQLGLDYVVGALKPGRRGFRMALERMGTAPEKTAVVGDQIFTDVLGGNRLGLYTILVPPLATAEFAGTRWVNRRLERLVNHYLRGPARDPGDSV